MTTDVQAGAIEQFFQTDVNAYVQGIAELEQAVATRTPQVDRHFGRLCQLLHDIRDACGRLETLLGDDLELRKSVQRRYQQAIAPWMDQSWMMRHAKSKPRGYAGDFELLQAIYDGRPKSFGLGGYLDFFFLSTELGRAVPARMQALRRFLRAEFERREGHIDVLDAACGPCAEFADGVEIPESCQPRIACLDFDADALDFVRTNVAGRYRGHAEFDFIRYNVLRMRSAKNFVEQHGRYDVLYSVGLCDYLPDRHLAAVLRGWRETLTEDGVVYVAFKDAHRYCHIDYQWVLDWYFYRRDEQDCRRILQLAGWDADCLEMERDATGIIMNFVAHNNSSHARRRLDQAHSALPHRKSTAPISGEVGHKGGDSPNLTVP